MIKFSSSLKLNEIHLVDRPFNENLKNIILILGKGQSENLGKIGNNRDIFKNGDTCCKTHLQIILSYGNILKIKNIIRTAVKINHEEILEVKTFLKMSTGFKCRGHKVEPRFYSFL